MTGAQRAAIVFRLWWFYVLLALTDLGLATWYAVHRGPGWGIHVGVWTAQGLTFGAMGLLFRRQLRS